MGPERVSGYRNKTVGVSWSVLSITDAKGQELNDKDDERYVTYNMHDGTQ